MESEPGAVGSRSGWLLFVQLDELWSAEEEPPGRAEMGRRGEVFDTFLFVFGNMESLVQQRSIADGNMHSWCGIACKI